MRSNRPIKVKEMLFRNNKLKALNSNSSVYMNSGKVSETRNTSFIGGESPQESIRSNNYKGMTISKEFKLGGSVNQESIHFKTLEFTKTSKSYDFKVKGSGQRQHKILEFINTNPYFNNSYSRREF